jgi:hypothetical protein
MDAADIERQEKARAGLSPIVLQRLDELNERAKAMVRVSGFREGTHPAVAENGAALAQQYAGTLLRALVSWGRYEPEATLEAWIKEQSQK